MERTDSTNASHHPGQDTALLWSFFGAKSSPRPARADERMAAASQEEEVGVNNHIPVFLDRTFRMIEQVPDDIVCWSTAGDSFIIKQVRAREPPASTSKCFSCLCLVFFCTYGMLREIPSKCIATEEGGALGRPRAGRCTVSRSLGYDCRSFPPIREKGTELFV